MRPVSNKSAVWVEDGLRGGMPLPLRWLAADPPRPEAIAHDLVGLLLRCGAGDPGAHQPAFSEGFFRPGVSHVEVPKQKNRFALRPLRPPIPEPLVGSAKFAQLALGARVSLGSVIVKMRNTGTQG